MVNTNAWIKATIISKPIKIKPLTLIKALNVSKLINKCPAVIFALNRRLKVRGRINCLTVSTKTINLTKYSGLLEGTKCAKVKVHLFTMP